jgi:hypothetical protein
VLAEFGSRSPRTLKCGFGTRSPSCDTFSCPCVRRARTTWSSLVDLVTREARKDARRRSAARRRSLRPSRRRESNHRRQARAVARNGRRPDVEIEAILSGCGSAQVDVVPARNGLRSPVSAARRSRLQPAQAGANATRRSARCVGNAFVDADAARVGRGNRESAAFGGQTFRHRARDLEHFPLRLHGIQRRRDSWRILAG